jgi:cytochrome c553
MLTRLLSWLLLPLAMWLAWRWAKTLQAGNANRSSPGNSPSETLVACARCGLRLPKSEAVPANGLHYCGTQHRDEPENLS